MGITTIFGDVFVANVIDVVGEANFLDVTETSGKFSVGVSVTTSVCI